MSTLLPLPGKLNRVDPCQPCVQVAELTTKGQSYLYHSRRSYFFHTILRIHRGCFEPFPLISAKFVLRSGSGGGTVCGVGMTNIQHCINYYVDATLLCNGNCAQQLALGPPTGRNGAFLVKFTEIPLKFVRT